jgi:L-lactate dehydrogenase
MALVSPFSMHDGGASRDAGKATHAPIWRNDMSDRYAAIDLIGFATAMLTKSGIDPDKAAVTAEILVEGDLMGHTTHGLALLGQNLDEAQAGRMLGTGAPDIVAQTQSIETWDGKRLPGPWLVRQAADLASARAAEIGLAGVAIRKSCHIACLAAYLKRITDRNQIMLLFSTDPSTASVAPTGGTRRIYTPNPMAAGWPTPEGPVLLDVSMSITTNGMTGRLRAEGRQFDHPWLLDGNGAPTRDPNAFFADPPGSILPLGGVEYGHKGYALGIMLEALTSALVGYGRADAESRWGANALVLVIDPARTGGTEAFLRETGWMAHAIHTNPPVPGGAKVRLPGERGLALRTAQLAKGVSLHPAILPGLAARAAAIGVALPQARAKL